MSIGIKAIMPAVFVCLTACGNDNQMVIKDIDKQAFIKHIEKQLVFVEGGEFEMGARLHANRRCFFKLTFQPHSFQDMEPVHNVQVSSFYISKYEVRYDEYDYFLAATGRIPKYHPRNKKGPRHPASGDWYDAKAYCGWLAEITGRPFDLPTEAQWEYAARSGGRSDMVFSCGDSYSCEINYSEGDTIDYFKELLPVGTYPPNYLGLYDMSGNGEEWVLDWHGEDYYAKSPLKDPRGPETGDHKILRGGNSYDQLCYTAVYWRRPVPIAHMTKTDLGLEYVNAHFCFRCVLNESKQPAP